MDAGLGDAGLTAAFADAVFEYLRAAEVEDGIGDEVVVEDDVGVGEQMGGTEGEEIGVAGAGAYEIDGSFFGRP